MRYSMYNVVIYDGVDSSSISTGRVQLPALVITQ